MRYAIANKINTQVIYSNNVTVVSNVVVRNVVVGVQKAWRVPGSKAS